MKMNQYGASIDNIMVDIVWASDVEMAAEQVGRHLHIAVKRLINPASRHPLIRRVVANYAAWQAGRVRYAVLHKFDEQPEPSWGFPEEDQPGGMAVDGEWFELASDGRYVFEGYVGGDAV